MIFSLIFNILFLISQKQVESIDEYLKKWTTSEDYVLVINYKTNEIIYTYNKYNMDEEIQAGSIFKIVSTYNILKYHPKLENYNYNCNHKDKINSQNTECWNKKGHGLTDLKKGLIVSCNQYFYSLYKFIDPKDFFNLGKQLGLFNNMNYESIKDIDKMIPYIYAGNHSILKANAYELIAFISLFANGGMLFDVKNNRFLYSVLDTNILNKISSWLRIVVTKGTGSHSFFKSYGFSGKTGTVIINKKKYNGIFAGYLTEQPYSVVVKLTNKIGSNAAQIASDVFYLILK